MIKLFFFIISILPLYTLAQVEITLQINQPPEFGFDVLKQDTTIVIGGSLELGSDIIIVGTGEYKYSWSPSVFLNDSTILNPVATPTDTTTFVLTIYDNNGCSFSVNYTVNVREVAAGVLDIARDEFPLKVVLFPNPNNGLFKVQFKGSPGKDIKLFVVDNMGRYIYNKNIANFEGEHTETIQLNLSSGTYALEVISSDTRLQRQFIIH